MTLHATAPLIAAGVAAQFDALTDEWEDFSCPFAFEEAAQITADDLNRCAPLAILHEYRAEARGDRWIVTRRKR